MKHETLLKRIEQLQSDLCWNAFRQETWKEERIIFEYGDDLYDESEINRMQVALKAEELDLLTELERLKAQL